MQTMDNIDTDIHRHIGGLESYDVRMDTGPSIHRHIGGLES